MIQPLQIVPNIYISITQTFGFAFPNTKIGRVLTLYPDLSSMHGLGAVCIALRAGLSAVYCPTDTSAASWALKLVVHDSRESVTT